MLDGGDVQFELHPVADEHVAAAERLIELHPVVAAGQLTGDLEADALIAIRVDIGPLELGVENNVVRDAMNRQLPRDPKLIAVECLDLGGLETQLRVVRRVEASPVNADARRAATRSCRPTGP